MFFERPNQFNTTVNSRLSRARSAPVGKTSPSFSRADWQRIVAEMID
jgi:hypothetical protein